MNRVPLYLFPLCDKSKACLSACSRDFNTKEFRDVRKRVRDHYACVVSPEAEAIDAHMKWFASQNVRVSEHLQRVWEVLSGRFSEYSASQRDEVIRYMCFFHRDYLGISKTEYVFFLKDPRPPSPGYFWRWSRGEWIYDPQNIWIMTRDTRMPFFRPVPARIGSA